MHVQCLKNQRNCLVKIAFLKLQDLAVPLCYKGITFARLMQTVVILSPDEANELISCTSLNQPISLPYMHLALGLTECTDLFERGSNWKQLSMVWPPIALERKWVEGVGEGYRGVSGRVEGCW